MFYLAQTLSCLGELAESRDVYAKRAAMEGGFSEETFHSLLKTGELSIKTGIEWPVCMSWLLRAFEHSNRVEPLLLIAWHYKNKSEFMLAFTFLRTACSLSYPHDAILFVDKKAYEYTRWHLMGIVAYYTSLPNNEQLVIGKEACEKAIESGNNVKLDTHNLQFYVTRPIPSVPLVPSKKTKSEFIRENNETLRKHFPRLSEKQIESRANLLWKKERATK